MPIIHALKLWELIIERRIRGITTIIESQFEFYDRLIHYRGNLFAATSNENIYREKKKLIYDFV